MNNDDIFKNTNNKNNDRTSAGLTSELEVRVVAWVLGEAASAEAVELARLAAENAALADFKRRIEAVHGLVGAAARPVSDAMPRLSDERRAKVLAVIGEDAAEASEARTEDRGSVTPRWVLAWNKWALPMAACITLCVLLGAMMAPSFQKVRKPKRPAPSMTMMGPSGSAIAPADTIVPTDAPMVMFASGSAGGGRVLDTNEPAASAAAMPPPAPMAQPVSQVEGEGSITLGGANIYSGGTLVTGGTLGIDAVEQTKSLTKAGSGRLSGEKNQLYAANQEMASADGFAESVPATPTTVTASRGGILVLNGNASSASLVTDADRSRATLFDTARRNDTAGKDRGSVSGSYASNDKMPVLGDVPLEGRLFKSNEVAMDALKSDQGAGTRLRQSFAEADESYPVHEAPQSQTQGVTIIAGTVQHFESSGVAGASTGQLQAPASKPAKKRQTITITAGTPQEFEVRESTETENQVLRNNAISLAADHFAPPTSTPAPFSDESEKSAEKDQRQLLAKGRSQYLAGDLNGAQESFRVAESLSPDDRQAPLFLERIAKEKSTVAQLNLASTRSQMSVEVSSAWQRPAAYVEDAKVARKPAQPAFDESLRLETATNQQAVSTFSLHVSDASFRIAKAALARGEAPDPASIRPEEFYNAFDYGDPSAVAGEPVACRIEQSAHPFLQQRNLVRIAMKVPATGRGAGQPLRLTVLLDTSGSMEREDRAASVRAALTSLVSLLGADDRITLIGFARQPHLLADRVPGNQAAGLADLVAKTPFEGGTNLEEALKLAGNLARGQFIASAQNRIVLLTDGAANLGNDDPAQLAEMIAALRQQGIAFDACGVGADGLDDTILEALTRKGDGRYAVINSPEEADAGFAHKLAGAFRPAAENVKVQVRFNPSRVAHYRLIGFEQHRLKTEDFRNDRVDAAELAAEEAAVALYQVEVLPDGEGELGEVFVRFRDVATGNMVERSWTLAYAPQPSVFARGTPSMKLAGTAAFLAEKLRGGDLAAQIRLDELAPVVNALHSDYANDARVQDLVTMFAQARRLTGE